VATSVTNFDIHDIARACQVYDVNDYYIINPMKEQLMFVSRVLDHWKTGYGAKFNPMRRTALGPVKVAENLEEALRDWSTDPGIKVIGTSAKEVSGIENIGFRDLQKKFAQGGDHFLLFGTGFGLHPKALERCNWILEPIRGVGPNDYRHLSVRSAVSICLDRLLGAW